MLSRSLPERSDMGEFERVAVANQPALYAKIETDAGVVDESFYHSLPRSPKLPDRYLLPK